MSFSKSGKSPRNCSSDNFRNVTYCSTDVHQMLGSFSLVNGTGYGTDLVQPLCHQDGYQDDHNGHQGMVGCDRLGVFLNEALFLWVPHHQRWNLRIVRKR